MSKKASNRRVTANYICTAGLLAATYVVLTFVSAMLGLDKGPIQFRISEALCIFAVFSRASVPGMSIGCLISGILLGASAYDIVFGTLATLFGILASRALKKYPYVAPLPYVISNTVIIPFVLKYAYGIDKAFWFIFATVGIGEAVCAYGGGILLYVILLKTKTYKYFR